MGLPESQKELFPMKFMFSVKLMCFLLQHRKPLPPYSDQMCLRGVPYVMLTPSRYGSLTLGAHAQRGLLPSARMRSEGYCSCRVCVCLSVKSHLTSGASVRPENAVTYSAGDEGQKICGVFSETAPLPRSSTPSVVRPCV